MAIYKLVSSKEVIAAVDRNFKLNNSNWINDAIEAIGEGLELLSISPALQTVYSDEEIIDGRVKLPCNLHSLQGVEHLKESGSHHSVRLKRTGRFDFQLNGHKSHNHNGYFLNPDYIHCPHDKGVLRIYYFTIPVDTDGFPLIPDNAEVKIALRWYILMFYLSRGNFHSTFKYQDAEQKWNEYVIKAKNKVRAMDSDERQRFKEMWQNLFPYTRTWENEFSKHHLGSNYDDNIVVRVPYILDDEYCIPDRAF